MNLRKDHYHTRSKIFQHARRREGGKEGGTDDEEDKDKGMIWGIKDEEGQSSCLALFTTVPRSFLL